MMTKPIAMLVAGVILSAGMFLLGECPAEASEAPADAKWIHVELSTSCDLFALDPGSGAVLAVDGAGKATLYPKATIDGSSKKVVGPVRTMAKPTCVLFKQYKGKGYFVICSAGDSQVIVLAADSLQVAAKITTKRPVNRVATTGRGSDDPYVYCASGIYGAICISLETMAFIGETRVKGNDIAVSADGNIMYSRSIGNSPTGFDAYKKVPARSGGPPQWVQVLDEHESVGRYVPDPLGRFCVVGMSVRTADLRGEVASLDFAPACFFRTLPVIVGLSDKNLMAASANTFKTFATEKLPDVLFKKDPVRARQQRGRPVPVRIVIMADDANKRVIAARGRYLAVRTLKALKAPNEPLLACNVRAPGVLFVGRQAVIPVRPLDKGCTVKLGEAPEGMKFTADQLVWTPTVDQVGPNRAVLKLSGGGVEISQTVMLTAACPHVVLPFTPAGISVSPDGTRAVAWSKQQRDMHGRATEPSRIALIDLVKLAILVQRAMPYVVRTASIDAHFIYVAPGDANRINALDLKHLLQKRHVVTDSQVAAMVIVASKRMGALTVTEGPTVYELPELKRAALPVTDIWRGWGRAYESIQGLERELRNLPDDRYIAGPLPLAVGETWYASGCLFGPGMTKVRTFVNVTDMKIFGDPPRAKPLVPLRWGRRIFRDRLVTHGDQTIVQLNFMNSLVLPRVPVAVTLATGITRRQGLSGHQSYFEQWTRLILRQLVSGKIVRTMNLQVVEQPYRKAGYAERIATTDLTPIVARGRTLTVVVDDKIFVHRITAETLGKCPIPLGFAPPETVHMLDLTRPTTIKLKTIGGTEPIAFESLGSLAEVKVDRKTGVVTIDGPALAKAAATQVASPLEKKVGGGSSEIIIRTPREVVAPVVEAGVKLFKAYTGKSPAGLPVLVPIRVAATDRHQHVAAAQFQAVIVLPAKMLIASVEAEVAKARKTRELRAVDPANKERNRKHQAMLKKQREESTRPATSEAIRRLERRIEKLEAQIELLAKLLKAQNGDRKRPGKPGP